MAEILFCKVVKSVWVSVFTTVGMVTVWVARLGE